MVNYSTRLGFVCAALAVALILQGWFSASAQPPQKAPAVPIKPALVVPVKGLQAEENESGEFKDRVTLPRDRSASFKIDGIKSRLKSEEWSEAIQLIQSILDLEKDAFYKDDRGKWVSVRAEANRLLGSMPREGLQFYELRYGDKAKSALQQGKQSGDPRVYADVALRYMHTEVGDEAAALLGTYHLDHGRYVVAALCFERILQREGALDRLPLMTLYKAAVAFERAGDAKNRDRVWGRFAAKYDNRQLPPALRRLGLNGLKAQLARKDDGGQRSASDWPLFMGTPDRADQSDGGAPYLIHRFKTDTIREVQTRTWIDRAVREQMKRKEPVLSAFHPIAVGDRLIYRSYWGIHAVPLKTGKLEDGGWDEPCDGSLDRVVKNLPYVSPQTSLSAWSEQYLLYKPSLLFDNSLLGTLSADNSRVYFVEDLALPPPQDATMGFRINARPNLGEDLNHWFEHNKLVARGLQSGKLLWELGTTNADDDFAKHFFLGPPLPLGDKLYVLAEVNSEIRLLCLDPYTLEVQARGDPPRIFKNAIIWSQTLCIVQRKFLDEGFRRTHAASLSYGDGVLVCPTNAGVVIGVDLLTRSLLWAHSYIEGNEQEPMGIQGGFPRRGRGMPVPIDAYTMGSRQSSWGASAPVVREGKVVFTAPDGQSVHCLNLRDGSLLWKQKQSSETKDLYLAGVFRGKVLLVGTKYTRALALGDGKEIWRVASSVPSGRGVANDTTYFLPVAEFPPGEKGDLINGEVWAIDIEKGQVLAKSRSHNRMSKESGEVPGNLILHGGDVLSQTALAIAAYPQLAVKEQEISALLGKNPKDPKGLTERGELRLHRGDLPAAVADLRLALENKPSDDVRLKARGRLYESLAELLEKDFPANEKYLKEFDALVAIPVPEKETPEAKGEREKEQLDRRAHYLRLVAKGHEQLGRLREALLAYMEVAGLGIDKLVSVPDAPGTLVRPDIWAKGRISDMLKRASAKPDDRQLLAQALEEQWKQVQMSANAEGLRRFTQAVGPFCEQGRKARFQLAELLMEQGGVNEADEAELNLHTLYGLRKVLESPTAEQVSAQAVEALARLNVKRSLLEDAGYYYNLLSQEYAKVTVRDGKTGEDLYLEAATDKRLIPHLTKPLRSWLGGHEIHARMETGGSGPDVTFMMLESEGEILPFFQRHRLGVKNHPRNQFVLLDRITGEERHTFPLLGLPEVPLSALTRGRMACNPIGHLVVFRSGHYVYGYDPLNSKQPVSWKKNLLGNLDPPPNTIQFNAFGNDDTLEALNVDQSRETVGSLAAVRSNCVCLMMKDRGLVALDPLTGSEMWARSEVPAKTEIFGDDEHLYLVPPSTSSLTKGIALRASDGVPVAVPEFLSLYRRKKQVVGRHLLLQDDHPQGSMLLRLYDVHTGKDVWSRHFESQAHLINSRDRQLTGVVEANGKASLFKLRTGEEALRCQIDPAHLANSPQVQLVQDSDHVYLLLNNAPSAGGAPQAGVARNTPVFRGTLLQSLKAQGPLYAFERATGRQRWRFDLPYLHTLVLEHFDDLPFLLFATSEYVQQPNAGFKQLATILALDKRDGRVIYRDESGDSYRQTVQQFQGLRADPRGGTFELSGVKFQSSRQAHFKVIFTVVTDKSKTDAPGTPPTGAKGPGKPSKPSELQFTELSVEEQMVLIQQELQQGNLSAQEKQERMVRLQRLEFEKRRNEIERIMQELEAQQAQLRAVAPARPALKK